MRDSFLPEVPKKERDSEAICQYVERAACAALARWVCYRFWCFTLRDQYPHGGWENIEEDRSNEEYGGDYRGPMGAEELQAYTDENMHEPIRGSFNDTHIFPGFAGYVVRPDDLTFADYLGALPQRVAATLGALEPGAVSDICAFLRVAHGKPLGELEFNEDDYASNSTVAIEVLDHCSGELVSRDLTLFAFVPSRPHGIPVPIYNALSSRSESTIINVIDLCAMRAISIREPEEAV